MFNQALNINKPQDNQKSNEFTEEDYEQINKDISQALFDMKKDNQDQEENNNGEDNENEDIIDFFHRDFFSDSSNSISFDNNDISEKSFKSANVEMKNNSIKNNMMKDNIINNPFFNKDIPENKISNKGNKNEKIKLGGNQDNNFQNKIIDNFGNNGNKNSNNNVNNNMNKIFQTNNGNINNLNLNPHFNNSNFPMNPLNNQLMRNNNYFNNMIPNDNNQILQMNNTSPLFNYNNNNVPRLQMNNFPINNNPNNIPIFNNGMNNNINFVNQNPNNFVNNSPLYNVNIINYNNNLNNSQILMNDRKKNNNNLFSYPIISERGVPGLYNLDSPKNIINLENILRNRDKRTTLIIRNIPNKYTIALLLKELNHNFENKFDIVYLPQDYINNSNLGFGFINFLNPMHLILFYEEFVNKKWNFFNSKKRCNLAYSKYQGKNELIKYILTKLGISSLDNNSENIKKSFFINNNKNLRAPIEIPIKYYTYFVSYHPFSLCHNKDDKIFIVDKYYNI
jgi:hypothetical protein